MTVGNVRWSAPELFCIPAGDAPRPTVSVRTDIYSFGCVLLEVSRRLATFIATTDKAHTQILTGKNPYHYLNTDYQVVLELHHGIKPH